MLFSLIEKTNLNNSSKNFKNENHEIDENKGKEKIKKF